MKLALLVDLIMPLYPFFTVVFFRGPHRGGLKYRKMKKERVL